MECFIFFLYTGCWFCVSSCYICFALISMHVKYTYMRCFHTIPLLQSKYTHVRTHTHMYEILEPSFLVTSMALTRITTTKTTEKEEKIKDPKDIPKQLQLRTCKNTFERGSFNDAHKPTNQLTGKCTTLNCEIRFEFVTSAQNIKYFFSQSVSQSVVVVVLLLILVTPKECSEFLALYA